MPTTPLNDAHQVGFLLSKIPFTKPALSLEQQINLLVQRGMIIPDQAKAEHYLRYIGYYRLSGYWHPFQSRTNPFRPDDFLPGTDFQTILDLYIFDRRLRVLLMDAIERIEVSARAVISNTMSEAYGPHWYLDPQYFNSRSNRTNFKKKFSHTDFLNRARQEAGLTSVNSSANPNKQTDFIRHYTKKYEPADPPSWMIFEVLPLGSISFVYENLCRADQKTIATGYNLHPTILQSWLHSISHIRNLCAHHSRVWNRQFRIIPIVAHSERHHIIPEEKFYAHAVAIQTLLKQVSGDTHWVDRLEDLLADYPNIKISDMGFPASWRQEKIWQ